MTRFWIAVLFTLCITTAFSQTTLDVNPFSLRWNQVNTLHFKVIYPIGFEEQAQRMANTLEHIHDPEARSMGSNPRKITVVLQNQSSVSNAFVSITPRRAEFYTMPPQDYNFLGTNDWLNLLASHEYRHIVQFQHSNRGLSRFFYYLFGSNTLAVLSHAAAPNWFWEGDAVATETAFTHGGRGRIPNFGVVFRTNLLEGRTFNYQKQYLRSYKNNIPDHYVLGYHMVSYLRRKTKDPEIWGKITAHAWNIPIIPFRFSSSIKMETGLTVNGLYRAMATDLKKEWQSEIDKLTLTKFEDINTRTSRAYTNYSFPQPLADGSIVVMKSGIGNIEEFRLLKDGREIHGYTPGIVNGTGMLSTAGSKVVWNEYGYDPRWAVRNYTLIKAYDFNTRRKFVIGGRKTRYAGASISPDGTKIVTVQSGNDYKTALVVLSFPDGSVLKQFSTPENSFYSMPRWSDTGNEIVVVKTLPAGKTLSIINYSTGEAKDITAASQENVGHPAIIGNYLFFNSPVSGIDNIYAIDLQTSKRFAVTSSKYGAYNAAISSDRKSILYNEQKRDGYDVVKAAFEPSQWVEYTTPPVTLSLAENLTQQEGRSGLFDSIPKNVFTVKKYSKLKGMIHPYSWGPLLDYSLTQPYAAISSRDILSTTSIDAGYQYDISEGTGAIKANASYQGFFSIIDASFSSGDRKVNKGQYPLTTYGISRQGDTTSTVRSNQTIKLKWKEQNVEIGLRVPLNFTHSRYYQNISIADYIGYTKNTGFTNGVGNERYIPAIIVNDTVKINNNFYARSGPTSVYPLPDYVGNGTLVYNHLSVSAYNLMKQSKRDINSKFGQLLYLDLYTAPAGGDYQAGNFSIYGQVYFPGLFKHHSFWGYAAFQGTKMTSTLDNYYFRNQIPLPRGLSISRYQSMFTASGNYTLPVWYPDVHIGPLLNIQRFRANAFFDYGYGQTVLSGFSRAETYMSSGVEVKVDFNIMRFLPQFNVGVRVSEGLSQTVSKVEILIGTINF